MLSRQKWRSLYSKLRFPHDIFLEMFNIRLNYPFLNLVTDENLLSKYFPNNNKNLSLTKIITTKFLFS